MLGEGELLLHLIAWGFCSSERTMRMNDCNGDWHRYRVWRSATGTVTWNAAEVAADASVVSVYAVENVGETLKIKCYKIP